MWPESKQGSVDRHHKWFGVKLPSLPHKPDVGNYFYKVMQPCNEKKSGSFQLNLYQIVLLIDIIYGQFLYSIGVKY